MAEITSHALDHNSTVGFKPSRYVPDSEKTPSWAKEMADWCIASANITHIHPIQKFYNLFNGQRDTKQFEYITKTFGIEFPAKIKHIPLIRPKINRLIGEEQERYLEYDLVAVDNEAIGFKKEEMFRFALRKFLQLQQGEISEEEYFESGKYLKRGFKVNFEVGAHKALEEYIYSHRLAEIFSEGFKHKIISGRDYYRVRVDRIGEDPITETIASMDLYYAPNEVEWVSDCDWAVHVKRLSSTEILDAYGDKMTADEFSKLNDQRDLYAKQAVKVRSMEEMDELQDMREMDPDYYMAYDADLWDVYEVEFKAIRKVNIRTSPNKYDPEKPFIHILSDEEVLELPSGRREREVSHRYMEELWRVVRIGEDIYPMKGRVKHPERDTRHPSKVKLSFEGMTFSNLIKPFSLVEVTYDIQMLYDILHFHKENLIALSGSKGAVMDLALLPDFGYGFASEQATMENIRMWLYYKKMGSMFVDSSRRENIQLNQIGTYDDTLGAGLEAILAAIEHLERTAGEVISVNRQRMGQGITSRDGQKTNADAVEQSSLATEPLYNEHDNTKERVMSKILNSGKIAWKNGKNGAFMNRHLEQDIFTLEPEFSIHDYNLFLTNKYQSKRRLEDLKNLMLQLSVNGQVNSSVAIDVLLATSLTEVEAMLKEDIAKTEQSLMEMQQQEAQLQQSLETAKSQIEQQKIQLEIQKIQSDIQAKQGDLEIKERELNHKIDYDNKQLQLERERIDLEALQLKLSDKAKEVKND